MIVPEYLAFSWLQHYFHRLHYLTVTDTNKSDPYQILSTIYVDIKQKIYSGELLTVRTCLKHYNHVSKIVQNIQYFSQSPPQKVPIVDGNLSLNLRFIRLCFVSISDTLYSSTLVLLYISNATTLYYFHISIILLCYYYYMYLWGPHISKYLVSDFVTKNSQVKIRKDQRCHVLALHHLGKYQFAFCMLQTQEKDILLCL